MHRRIATIVIAALAGVGLSAVPAHAATLSCGDTITSDVTLTGDLTCSGTALTVSVEAPDTVQVTLDGHRITGDGTGVGIAVASGSRITPGSLTVSDGTIRGFGYALVSPVLGGGFGAMNLTLDDVTLRSNGRWLANSVRDDVTVTGSRIIDSGYGGASVEGTITVQDSRFLRSSVVSFGESYNYLYGSTFDQGGFRHGVASNVVAVGNTFRNCDVGISAADVWPPSPTQVDDNVFDGCRVGARVSGFAGGATVRGNTFSDNTEAGLIFSAGGVLAIDISGNRFLRNGGDGLSGTGNAAVVVANNRAVRNGGHGINVSGVTDGGGNRASGNATAPQCVGVTCTR